MEKRTASMAQMKKELVVCEIIVVKMRDRGDTFIGRYTICSKSWERLKMK